MAPAATPRVRELDPDLEPRFFAIARKYPVPTVLTALALAIVVGLGLSWWFQLRPQIRACPAEPIADRAACETANTQRTDRWAKSADIGTKAATGALALAAALVALQAHDLNRRNHDLDREGQITNRYSAAIDKLGETNKPEVVLGGIYALERIARDSPDKDLSSRCSGHIFAASAPFRPSAPLRKPAYPSPCR